MIWWHVEPRGDKLEVGGRGKRSVTWLWGARGFERMLLCLVLDEHGYAHRVLQRPPVRSDSVKPPTGHFCNVKDLRRAREVALRYQSVQEGGGL